MSPSRPTYQVRPYPLSRRVIVDTAVVTRRRNTITGLVEFDVTEARRIIHQHQARTGEVLSFTAFILACLGRAIADHPQVHARLDLLGRLIVFDEADCTTSIEVTMQGQPFPLAHIIRDINHRSFRSIHDEIRAVQADPTVSPSYRPRSASMVLFFLLPAFIRRSVYEFVARVPVFFKQMVGTVFVSSFGMFGNGGGWGIGTGTVHTLMLMLGGISEKPVLIEGQIVAHEFLSVTASFDHDIIDGAPAARFIARFGELVESAYGLDDYRQ